MSNINVSNYNTKEARVQLKTERQFLTNAGCCYSHSRHPPVIASRLPSGVATQFTKSVAGGDLILENHGSMGPGLLRALAMTGTEEFPLASSYRLTTIF